MRIALLVTMLVLPVGAATPTGAVVDVAAPGATSRPWWEYYDDGLRAIDRSDWESAIAALETALEGKSKSDARARTYGMRFVAYFPHYYMGVAYFKLRNLPTALEHLQQEQHTGAARKAASVQRQLEFYLAATTTAIEEEKIRVADAEEAERRRRSAELGVPIPEPLPKPVVRTPAPAAEEGTPPAIAILTPREGVEPTREETVRVQGNAVDRYGIASVTLEVNGTASDALTVGSTTRSMKIVAVPASEGGAGSMGRIIDFFADVPLPPGTSLIVVQVQNVRGKVSTETREVKREGK